MKLYLIQISQFIVWFNAYVVELDSSALLTGYHHLNRLDLSAIAKSFFVFIFDLPPSHGSVQSCS